MARDDPFAGIRLSEQTTTGKLDQHLFSPEPPTPPPVPKPTPPAKAGPATAPTKPAESAPSPSTVPPAKTATVSASRFDLKAEPLYKASFLFTQEELEGLEDLKLELRRQYDTKVTKNGLIRSALHSRFVTSRVHPRNLP